MKEVLVIPTMQEGVFLRQHASSQDDFDLCNAVWENPSHVNNFGNPVSQRYSSLRTARAHRLDTELLGWTCMGIRDSQTGLKGNIESRPNADIAEETEIGIWLRASATGQNFATLAMESMIKHLRVQYSRIYTRVHVDNERSIKLMERVGMAATGVIPRPQGDAIIFDVL